jgi:hypothetical protein
MLLGAVATATAQSTLIRFEETGLLSGSLGGITFNNAEVELTTVVNTADITYVLMLGQFPTWYASGANGNTTIQIQGFSLATFTGTDSFGVFSQDLSSVQPGLGVVGIGDNTSPSGILGNLDTSPNYEFSAPATFTGNAATANDFSFNTDQGILVLSATSGDATFTAEPVPEPSAMALAGLGILSLPQFRRRK